MSSGYKRTLELLKQLIDSKQNLADTLTEKGEEAAFNEPFDDLVEKAANYTPKTYIIVDENGNEVVGTLVEEKTVFTATANDIREGKVAASELGVVTGEKFIPSYTVSEGYRIITAGSAFTIPLKGDRFDYTKLQALICPYNTSISESVATEKVAINEGVYLVNSTELLATVVKDSENKQINLAVTNDSDGLYVLRYFSYKEMY